MVKQILPNNNESATGIFAKKFLPSKHARNPIPASPPPNPQTKKRQKSYSTPWGCCGEASST
jgi:hypothetical protein